MVLLIPKIATGSKHWLAQPNESRYWKSYILMLEPAEDSAGSFEDGFVHDNL